MLCCLKRLNISNLNENGSKLISEVHNAKLITELRQPAWKMRIIDADSLTVDNLIILPRASITTKPPAPAKLYSSGLLSNNDSMKG